MVRIDLESTLRREDLDWQAEKPSRRRVARNIVERISI